VGREEIDGGGVGALGILGREGDGWDMVWYGRACGYGVVSLFGHLISKCELGCFSISKITARKSDFTAVVQF